MEMITERRSPRVRITFDVPAELRRAARMEAMRQDMTVREYLTAAVEKQLAEDADGCEEEK